MVVDCSLGITVVILKVVQVLSLSLKCWTITGELRLPWRLRVRQVSAGHASKNKSTDSWGRAEYLG